jgi:hypothetical protein
LGKLQVVDDFPADGETREARNGECADHLAAFSQ